MFDEKIGQFLVSIGPAFQVIAVAVLIEFIAAKGRGVARTIVFNTAYAVGMTAFAVAIQPIANAENAFIASHVGIAPIPLPDTGVFILLSAVVLMLSEDFIFYWVHRAQHRFGVLWAMHSFHHSDDDLNATAANRHFWLDKPFFALIAYVPLGLVFQITPAVAGVYGLLFGFFSIFPHMNLRLELGLLTRVFTGPQVHRIHHSIHRHHFNTNFAGAFPLWDLLFGTYRAPERGEFPPTGVPELPSTPGPIEAILWPVYRLRASSSLGVKPNEIGLAREDSGRGV